MKKSSSQKIGILLLLIWLLCLGAWGYIKARSVMTHSTTWATLNPLKQESASPIQTSPEKSSLSMGVVELSVQDIEKMTDFYARVVGFEIVSTGATIVNLGDDNKTFLRLIEEKEYSFPKAWEAWLYHTAITHNSRKDVATRVARILELSPERYQWSSDHTATEAFYFSDPEGNGLELYYDRPRSEWKYTPEGKPIMWSTYIDTIEYIKRYREVPTSGGQTKMGHIHLKVGNIPDAEKFYRDILLFDVMNNMGNALFVSRDGYHHHLGMNTWESAGAGKRIKNTYGLRSFEIIYHEKELYEKVQENLKKAGYPIFQGNNSIKIEDPWGNAIQIILENEYVE